MEEPSMSKPKKSEPKAPKPKKEKAASEPLCVFAFRLSPKDRDTIHAAAGPGGASRFVLGAALAAATGDENTFAALVQSRASKK